ncbi:3-hydroxybenzoate 4-monooxygenase [Micrococcus flavus]|uniref:Phenol 2-monooxygenase n=1 Tax=Micrococcus flavus TaxID=384602 RepID=A0A4Y8X2H3_9MICC|nr:FAD-binding monooxygenase [Micrococcus flavus]MBB4881858.1 phenol 2-monooxygenase [Micrococcus flavus]TFI03595.1 3-hydroxybenzoate 4-monooxygenase [Micrococcus flavus]GGK45460.1 phenol 2-monooxygenase [Micrococcus flavus]
MLFHHHGYVSTDPRIHPAAGVGLDRPAELPDEMDVLIVGTGPAGMIAAAQLAMFPDVHTRIVERRPHRLEIGQADGIQARSVETFQAFGFASEIIDEAFDLTSMAFWNPDPENPSTIVRTQLAEDDPEGISEFPHLIVNQARILDWFAEYMENSPTRARPDYGWAFEGLDDSGEGEHPVTVTLRRTVDAEGAPLEDPQQGELRQVRARYVVGADGAGSRVRKAIGHSLSGDAANHAWGVMDTLAVTDFPDIRTKCAIHSNQGSILLIPREGGHLFRLYVDLGVVPEDDGGKVRQTPLEEVIRRAQQILHPYTLDVKEVPWHSVYEVGHRLTSGFDNRERVGRPNVFLLGDACHTHSAKAGQGMNVSMQDGWNLGWKLGQVLSGIAPVELVPTYGDERKDIAKNLIDFDKEWSTLMAKPTSELGDPNEVAEFYTKTAEFPAGFMTEYQPSLLTTDGTGQELATGFPIGKRFTSALVERSCDTNVKHLGHLHRADGRWRVYVFADAAAPQDADSKVAAWAQAVEEDPQSFRNRHTPADGPQDARFDIKVVYQQKQTEFAHPDVPAVFRPTTGPLGLIDLNNIFATCRAKHGEDIFDARGISRDGAVVVVRPDHYVSGVFGLDEVERLNAFFAGVLLDAR